MEQAAGEGWATLVLRGSSGYSLVPFGPLRTVLQIPPPGDPADLSASLERELLDMRTERGLLVLADDAHHLDESTAGLLHQLVAGGALVLLVTWRTDCMLPVALTDLWKDGLAERIELQNLSERESRELLTAMLGGDVQDSSARRIWRITDGNPLYLREVVHSSLETGSFTLGHGAWAWQGEWASGSRLQEIVASRLGRLSPEESTVMELLCIGGNLPLDFITGLASRKAVEDLERRDLVTCIRSGDRTEVAIGHPLHAEVLRGSMHELQQRAVRRNMLEALAASPNRRAEDRVRMACWSIESGIDVDPVSLQLGSDAALFGIGGVIAARLNEIVPGQNPSTAPTVRQDLHLAVRLAQAAYEQTGALEEGIMLATALTYLGRTHRAELVLAELAAKAQDRNDRLRLGTEVAWIRFWGGDFDTEGATSRLVDAIEEAGPDADPALRAAAFQELAGFKFNTACPAEALRWADESAAAAGSDLEATNAAAPAAAALAYLGRCGEAIALVDRAVPIAHEQGHPLAVATLLFTRASALSLKGQLEEAGQLMTWLRDAAIGEELQDATAVFGVILGEILVRQGRPASASRILRDSCGLLAERDVFGYRPWALAVLSRARAMLGEHEEALASLEEARATKPIVRHFDLSVFLARVETHLLAGNSEEAGIAAHEAVRSGRERGIVVHEALALATCLRVEPRPADADRLATLADLTDSDYVAVLAEYGRALVSDDPEGLLRAAERFASMYAWWAAADAAAHAARILDQRHHPREAGAAARAVAEYASNCEGYRPDATQVGLGPTHLTKRENEVARLAAAGRSNAEIAAEMSISRRTVENHLQRAYIKLGVSDRVALASALTTTRPE